MQIQMRLHVVIIVTIMGNMFTRKKLRATETYYWCRLKE